MDHIINITRFLTRQNICNDMQNVILSYYYTKQKYRLLILDYEKEISGTINENYLYYEVIPYGPIDKIDLTNLYKFVYNRNKVLDQGPHRWKITSYDKNGVNFTYYHQNFTKTTKSIIDELRTSGYTYAFGEMIDFYRKSNICYLKTIEI